MKKIIYLLGLSMALLMSSCSQDEVFYSCDPEIDAWAKDNFEELQSVDTKTFRSYATEYRMAIYNIITPEKRVGIWKEKINETLKLDWSEAEAEHIRCLLDMIDENINWYEKGVPEEEREKYEIMAYRWVEYAKEVLGWKQELAAAIAASPLFLKNTNGELIVSPNEKRVRIKSASELPKCTCNPAVSFCSPCRYDPCKEKTLGCGLLGLGICNGLGC